MTTTFKNIIMAGAVLSTVLPVAYGAAQAAPDFGLAFPLVSKQFDAGPDLTAIRARSFASVIHAETPAAGHFAIASKPVTFAMQDAGAFTNVFPPTFIHTAALNNHKVSASSMRSALNDISAQTKPASQASMRPLPTLGSSILVSSGVDVHNGRDTIWKVYESASNTPARVELITVSSVPLTAAKNISSDTAADYSGMEAVYTKTAPAGATKHLSAKACEALDKKLDAKHLKPATERADLANYGCGAGAAGTISG